MHRFAATLVLASAAGAQVPAVLSYTGTLSDQAGPVADGSYPVTFRLFDLQEGGTQVWLEPLSVTTRSGVFTALLGAGAVPLDPDALSASQVWLEIEVGGEVLAPRLQVVSVPYALAARSAQLAGGVACTGCIQATHVDATQIQRRVAGSCSLGDSVSGINADGSVSCTAGLLLAGSGIALTAARSDHNHGGDYLPLGASLSCPGTDKVAAVDPLTGSVFCAPDIDTTYTQGAGIAIVGTTISTSFAGFACGADDKLSGFDAAGNPVCSMDTIRVSTQLPRTNVVLAADPTAGSAGRYTSITIGADGLPVISHRDATGGDLRVLKCGDPSCSAGNTASLVDDVGDTGEHTSIALGNDGLPIISYYNLGGGDLRVAHCDDPACATSTLTTVDGLFEDVGRFTSIAIGTDGFPVVSYRDVTNLDLKVAKCDDATCGSVTATTVDGAGTNVGEYTSIGAGADGLPVVAYYDAGAANLKVAKCGDSACMAGNTVTTVDGGGSDLGRHASLSLGVDGLPVIAHYNATAGRLRVVKCSDAACTGSTAATVDASADVGSHASLTVGADGLPVVAYHDATNGTLKLARCGSADCMSGNAIHVVDANAVVGLYAAVTISADGLPVISYRDVSGDGLKVAKCANAFCLDNWSRR